HTRRGPFRKVFAPTSIAGYEAVYQYEISTLLGFTPLLAVFAITGLVAAMPAISRIRRTGWRLRMGTMLVRGIGVALGVPSELGSCGVMQRSAHRLHRSG